MADKPELVIADASVAINFNAIDRVADILAALPYRVVISDIVQGELIEDRRSGRNDALLLQELIGAGHIAVVTLNAAALQVFADLVSGPAAQTLDDGEASTIAYAVTHGVVAAIDERKARRIGVQRFPHLRVLSTVELFMQPDVGAALGRAALSDAVFQALQRARMRVLPDHLAWVMALIGADRAVLCPSLPKASRQG